jgi:lactate dehydrogenase-like 2-hydroxyacid dehydrogenase
VDRVVVTHWVHPEVGAYLAAELAVGLTIAIMRRLRATRLELGDLLTRSDVVLLLTPLESSTLRLVAEPGLRSMRPGAFLVNVGRGSVVDEEAVADALHEGRLGGYAADVFAMEDRAEPGRPDAIPARQVRQALAGERPDHAVNEPLGPAG